MKSLRQRFADRLEERVSRTDLTPEGGSRGGHEGRVGKTSAYRKPAKRARFWAGFWVDGGHVVLDEVEDDGAREPLWSCRRGRTGKNTSTVCSRLHGVYGPPTTMDAVRKCVVADDGPVDRIDHPRPSLFTSEISRPASAVRRAPA
jgi:hypothetical protein